MTTVIEVCSLAGCASDCDEQGMLLEISLLSMWKLSIRPLESIFTYGVACGAIRSINGSGKNLRDEGGLVFTFCYLMYTENMPASVKNDRSFNKLSRIFNQCRHCGGSADGNLGICPYKTYFSTLCTLLV